MKIIGSVLVMVSSCGIGFLYADEIRKRKEELEELYYLMKLILGDIRYMRATFPEAIARAMNRHKGNYSRFLNCIFDKMSDASGIAFQEIWKNAVEAGLAYSAITVEDKQKLIRLGETINVTDREIVMSSFELYISELKEVIGRLQSDAQIKKKFYRSLGILTGIFIVVMFI